MNLQEKLKKRIKDADGSFVNLSSIPSTFIKGLENLLSGNRLNTLGFKSKNGHYFQIDLSPSKMEAYLSVYFNPEQPFIPRADLSGFIAESGLAFGINEGPLNEKAPYGKLKQSLVGLPIAHGLRPTPGRAGYMELLVQPYDASLADDLAHFDPVEVEQTIAVVHPPEKGQPGRNVMNEEEPAELLPAAEFKHNHTIKRLEDNGNVMLIAALRGHLVKKDDELSLHEELALQGDITTVRGNLIYNNRARVFGNIDENVTVNVESDLAVDGVISACHMQVRGELTLSHGVFGHDSASLVVGGNLSARYLNETAYLETGGDIKVIKEILNSTIWCKGRVESPSATIVGGKCFAHGGLTVQTLGSTMGVIGLVAAGLDYQEYRVKTILKPELERLLQKRDEALLRVKQQDVENRAALIKLIKLLMTEIENRRQEIAGLAQHFRQENPAAMMLIREDIFPGIKLMIGNHETEVKERIRGPVEVILKNSSVLFRKAR